MSGHPDYPFLEKLVWSVLRRRRFDGVSLDGVKFDFFTSRYTLVLSHRDVSTQINLPTELVDELRGGSEIAQRSRLKRLLKQALKWDDVDAEDD